VSLADTTLQLTLTLLTLLTFRHLIPSALQANLHMDSKPSCRKDAIEFVWRQPDAALTSTQKQSIAAALAKDTDHTASLYFLAPIPEQWLGTLKELLAPTGTLLVCGKLYMELYTASEQSRCSLSAWPLSLVCGLRV